jgi:hypothetical protein
MKLYISGGYSGCSISSRNIINSNPRKEKKKKLIPFEN